MSSNTIQDLISKFLGGNRPDVYLSVTPGVGLEMIQVDYANHTVQKYGLKPLNYNESLREIANIEEFKTAVNELFEELKISPKCNITLNLPTVLFGSLDNIPLMLGDDAITGSVTSEVEQSYIFKRHDPIVQWWDSNAGTQDSRKLFYSAVQKLVVDNITAALTELGANLVGLEMSLLSTLRALDYLELASNQMQEGVTWNMLTVNANGYTLVSMVGKRIVDYYEEAIAIKSYDGDEIYNVISASAQITLMSYPVNYLLVISETNQVSAEILAINLHIDCPVEFIENNKFKSKSFLPVDLEVLPDYEIQVSLSAIGVAIAKTSDYPIQCNFLGTSTGETIVVDQVARITIGGQVYEVTPMQATIVSFAFAVIVCGIIAIPTFLVLPSLKDGVKKELDVTKAEQAKLEAELKQLQEAQKMEGKFNVKNEVHNVLLANRAKLIAFSAIGESVPQDLWLNKFSINNNSMEITGGAGSVEDVYTFFRSLKDSTSSERLQLQKLEMIEGALDDVMADLPVTYEFSISDSRPSAAPAPAPAPADDGKNKKGKGKGKRGRSTGKAANIPAEDKLLSDTPIN